MYAKLFSRITESSLMEEPMNVRYTFMMMLAICDPQGYVIGTDIAIARRLNMPLNEFSQCVEVLMKPDPHSNSKTKGGRRVVRSDGERGYLCVNFLAYREIRDEDHRREYMRKYMANKRALARVNTCKQQLPKLAQEEAEGKGEEYTHSARELYPPELQTNDFPAAWEKWVQHLRERGKGMGDVQRDAVWRECIGAGAARSVQIIEACIKAGYKKLCWDLKLDAPVAPAAKRVPNYKTQLERDLDALQNGN